MITVPGTPVSFSQPISTPTAPPRLGEHSRQILDSLKFTETEIKNLISKKIIQTA